MEPIIGPGPAPEGLIKDSDTQHFMDDVIDASKEAPVIVDFWAPWCGPCKQLGPALEKAVTAAAGRVRLVKINIDENPEIAQQMRIQSIPAVFAFDQGQPVDGFVGALPDSQVAAFVEKLGGAAGPSPVEEALAQAAQMMKAGDLGGAAALYGEILKQSSGEPSALAGLARCYLENGDLERAGQTLAMVPPEHDNHADVVSARASLDLATQVGEAGDVGSLRAAVAQAPNDHQARYDLALALVSTGERDAGVAELIEIVRRDREWNEQSARKQLLKLFDAYGANDEVTISGRRQLSAILFS
jgi:putative thioredoxin